MKELSVVVQAGGASSRMGLDKAFLPFDGDTLIERVIKRVRPIADEILITTNNPGAYAFLNLPLFKDLIPGRGALGGLYTALKVASCTFVGVVACDMAFVSSKLLRAAKEICIATRADIVIPDTGNGLEPFHAIYRRESCIPKIAMALQDQKWRVDSWFDEVHVHKLDPEMIARYDPGMNCFFNINTPEDLEKAKALAAGYNQGA
jgi:molybdopterin-guanine dinucleotide biosynthesis protein A